MICKCWPIKGADSAGRTLDYIVNEHKVVKDDNAEEVCQILSRSRMESVRVSPVDSDEFFSANEHTIRRVMNYMENEKKIKQKYVSGYLCSSENAEEEFESARLIDLLRKTGSASPPDDNEVIAIHIVQSFPDGIDVSDDEVHQCGRELCEKLGRYQAVIASHVNPVVKNDGEVHGKRKHNHILVNAFVRPDKIDPAHPRQIKIHFSAKMNAMLRIWNDEIAIAHGFPIIRNPEDERAYSWCDSSTFNENYSWKARVKMDIETARRNASDWENYLSIIHDMGYQTRVSDKTFTYIAPDKIHRIRETRLGQFYTKEKIQMYWDLRDGVMIATTGAVRTKPTSSIPSLLKYEQEDLFIATPLGAEGRFEKHNYMMPLLNNSCTKEAAVSYYQPDMLYDICRADGTPVMAITGSELISFLSEEEAEKDKENSAKEEVFADDFFEEKKKEETYSNPHFINSRTKKPYHISVKWDGNKRRSEIDNMCMLAITVIKQEGDLWVIKVVPPGKENEAYYGKREWKIQNMIDSMQIAREVGITTYDEIEDHLHSAGADYSRIRASLNKLTDSLERMDAAENGIETLQEISPDCERILSMPDSKEKQELIQENKETLLKYKEAKAVLHRYKIQTPEEIKAFDLRYNDILSAKENVAEKLDNAAEQYRKLKKLQYNMRFSQDTAYCFGPAYQNPKQESVEYEKRPYIARNDPERRKADLGFLDDLEYAAMLSEKKKTDGTKTDKD